MQSLESEGGELILSPSLAKGKRVTNPELWLPDPLRSSRGHAHPADKAWALGNDPVAMPGAPPKRTRSEAGTKPREAPDPSPSWQGSRDQAIWLGKWPRAESCGRSLTPGARTL